MEDGPGRTSAGSGGTPGAGAGRAGEGLPGRKAMSKRARKAMARRRTNFVKPADPARPTRHLHVANTGVSCCPWLRPRHSQVAEGVRVLTRYRGPGRQAGGWAGWMDGWRKKTQTDGQMGMTGFPAEAGIHVAPARKHR